MTESPDDRLPSGQSVLTPNGTTNLLGIPEAEYSELQTERAYSKFNNPRRRDRNDKGGRDERD